MPKSLLRFATVFLCAIGLWGGLLVPGATSQVQALESVRDDVVITTLDNGLTVVLAPREGSAVSTVQVWIGVGSAQEPPELNGIAHFFEHMIFKGSTRFQDVDAAVEGWGGSSNAGTSFDYTNYYVSVPKEHAEASIDLVADILINGLFPEEELISERDVVLREGDQRNDNPDSYLFYQVWNAYYGQHPYGQPILGTEETVSSITRDDFLNWLDTYYVPNNMTVVVAGGIDPDRVLVQIEESFGSMVAKELPAFEPLDPGARSGLDELFLSRDVEQERLYMAWPAPPVEEFDDVVAMDVLLYLLSGNRSSRIYRNVIRDLGVITWADSYYFTTVLPAIFHMSAQYPLGETEVARSALLQEMELVLNGNVSAAEVETAKRVLVALIERQTESSSGMAFHLGFYTTVVGDPLAAFDYVDRIRQVSVQDVIEVSRKYVDLGTRLEVRMAPETAMEIDTGDPDGILVLDNGLRMILREDPTTNVVAFQTLVGTGTAIESSALAGVSSFTNALLLRGTQSQTEEEIFDAIENLGASLSQSQLPDMASVSLVATADTWQDALPIYLDVLTQPAFSEDEFNRLKRDSLLSIETQGDDNFGTIYDQLLLELYGDSGYGNPDLGTQESMENLTLAQVKDFYARHYVPENMVVTVVGNINAELMAARLGTALGALESTEPPFEMGSRSIDLIEPRTVTSEKEEANLAWVVMGFPGPPISSDDYAAMKVLNSIVGSGASSRMFTIIRDQQGLAYAAGSFFPSRAGDSHLAAYAIVLPEYSEAVVDDILAILYDVRDNGVTADELDLAIQRELGDFVLRNETAQEKSFDLGWYEMLGAGHQVDTDYPDRISVVTSEDVQRVAAEYLETYIVSVLQPPQ